MAVAMKTKRVLMVGPSVHSMGGVATVERNILESVLEGFHIDFLSTCCDGTRVSKVLLFVKAYLRILRSMSSYDLCHVHSALGSSYKRKYLVCRAANRHGVPYILHIHEGDFTEQFEHLSTKEQNKVGWVFNNAACVVALSESWRELFEGMFPKAKISVLENAVRVPDLSEEEKDSQHFFFLGRLCSMKGVDVLLKSMKYVIYRFPRAKLFIAGTGEKEPEYKALSKEYGLDSNVVFLGRANDAKKQELMQSCMISVLPSRAEGLPMAVLEAMAGGCAVVATRVGALPELIDDGVNGILVDADNDKSLADALIELIQKPDLALSLAKAGRNTVKERYSMNAYVHKLEDIYSSCIL